ncbi:MAG: 4Fe-4S dicluster domain-containing protein [Candidatus Abyssobacteria bacterium SURF_17]|jgi:anaerobic dimethyl sulfoxide reductase subunit B (iron-sulfur subunit)|uniref:Ferredoxin n=1 Tax=Candidatus Abyssobacteria bacterium SURF_17 TaxID=2093361 RepID=A0A419EXF3_9BACT|nr:MAG: 4Fe-4S dicluster domain-containing protein [Candidatus Abyssubacteria bacterium SURF_17]
MMKEVSLQLAFYFDQTRCTGCHTCVVACKDWHDLPAELVNWRRVTTHEEGTFPNVKVNHISLSCCHCAQPACAEACPEDAIYKRDADGVVLIDAERCTGCRVCEDACPYGAIQFRPDDGSKAEKCTFCADRLEGGEAPICVASCPMRALDFGPVESMRAKPEVAAYVAHVPDSAQTTGWIFIRPK